MQKSANATLRTTHKFFLVVSLAATPPCSLGVSLPAVTSILLFFFRLGLFGIVEAVSSALGGRNIDNGCVSVNKFVIAQAKYVW